MLCPLSLSAGRAEQLMLLVVIALGKVIFPQPQTVAVGGQKRRGAGPALPVSNSRHRPLISDLLPKQSLGQDAGHFPFHYGMHFLLGQDGSAIFQHKDNTVLTDFKGVAIIIQFAGNLPA
jgi:hypothetical protein